MAKKQQITSKKTKQEQAARASEVWQPERLVIELLSDATFSRGQGTAGQVDIEIEHDKDGAPLIGGKTVRGLLRDGWLSMQAHFPELREAAGRVLGHSQSMEDGCRLRIGDAQLPASLLGAVRAARTRVDTPLRSEDVLGMLTQIRHQTAEERETGAPAETTLRASRVALRGLSFEAPLGWLNGHKISQEELRVLALCALSVRHGGLLRNRGRGHLRITLDGDMKKTREALEGKS
jgi:hypothetical protein